MSAFLFLLGVATGAVATAVVSLLASRGYEDRLADKTADRVLGKLRRVEEVDGAQVAVSGDDPRDAEVQRRTIEKRAS